MNNKKFVSGKIFKSKVRNKLLITILIAVLLPVCILGFFSYKESYDILEKKLKTASSQMVDQVNLITSSFFKGNEAPIHMLAGSSSLSQYSEGMDNTNKTVSIPLYGQGYNLFKTAKENNGNINYIYFGNVNGGMYSYPELSLEGFDPRERPWYKGAIEKDGLIWTDPYTDDVTGKMVITVAKPVKYNNEVIGVIGADILLEKLSHSMLNQKIGRTGYLTAVTNSGIAVIHPNGKLLGTKDVTNQEFWETVKNDNHGFEDYTINGEQKFLSFVTNEKMDWKLMAMMEEEELAEDTNSIRDFTIIIIIISTIIAIVVAFVIAISISKPLNTLKKVFNKASNGDFTTEVQLNSKDEFGQIGRSFNTMLSNIRGLIKSVRDSSNIVVDTSNSLSDITDQTSTATSEVATTIEEIAKSATEQAEDTYKGVKGINELASQIGMVSKSNNNMNDIIMETGELGEEGLKIVKVLTDKSSESRESALKVNDIILEVDKSSKEIGTITETIGQIAEQTNLLALNAAIEAARVGEHGKGFAVVAEEVRQLAEQSSEAAGKVNELILQIQGKSKTAVNAMGEANEIVSDQNKVVGETEDIFTNISSSIQDLIEKVKEVKGFSMTMEEKKEEIVGVIENLSAVSEETSAATQQVSAATEEQLASIEEVNSHSKELKKLVDDLSGEVNKFKIDNSK